MPPAALHQPTNASAEANSSWLSPGWTVAPGSDMVLTLIDVSDTPGSVAPLALPGPQIPFSVPKSPDAVAALEPPVEVVVLLEDFELERPHADATTMRVRQGTKSRRRSLCR